MRTVGHAPVQDIAARKPGGFLRLENIAGLALAAMRMLRTRLEVDRLHELDDHQLLDIGLTRDDVRRAVTSPFFDDPSIELARVARLRAERFLDTGRLD